MRFFYRSVLPTIAAPFRLAGKAAATGGQVVGSDCRSKNRTDRFDLARSPYIGVENVDKGRAGPREGGKDHFEPGVALGPQNFSRW